MYSTLLLKNTILNICPILENSVERTETILSVPPIEKRWNNEKNFHI